MQTSLAWVGKHQGMGSKLLPHLSWVGWATAPANLARLRHKPTKHNNWPKSNLQFITCLTQQWYQIPRMSILLFVYTNNGQALRLKPLLLLLLMLWASFQPLLCSTAHSPAASAIAPLWRSHLSGDFFRQLMLVFFLLVLWQ